MIRSLVITPTNSTCQFLNTGQCNCQSIDCDIHDSSSLLHHFFFILFGPSKATLNQVESHELFPKVHILQVNQAYNELCSRPQFRQPQREALFIVMMNPCFHLKWSYCVDFSCNQETLGMYPDEKVTLKTPTNSTFQIFNTGQCLC